MSGARVDDAAGEAHGRSAGGEEACDPLRPRIAPEDAPGLDEVAPCDSLQARRPLLAAELRSVGVGVRAGTGTGMGGRALGASHVHWLSQREALWRCAHCGAGWRQSVRRRVMGEPCRDAACTRRRMGGGTSRPEGLLRETLRYALGLPESAVIADLPEAAAHLRAHGWRPDVWLRAGLHGVLRDTVVEYDSEDYHAGSAARLQDRAKADALCRAGCVVVRVRAGGLRRLAPPLAARPGEGRYADVVTDGDPAAPDFDMYSLALCVLRTARRLGAFGPASGPDHRGPVPGETRESALARARLLRIAYPCRPPPPSPPLPLAPTTGVADAPRKRRRLDRDDVSADGRAPPDLLELVDRTYGDHTPFV